MQGILNQFVIKPSGKCKLHFRSGCMNCPNAMHFSKLFTLRKQRRHTSERGKSSSDLKIMRRVTFIKEGGAETSLLTQCNPHSQEQLCKDPCWHNHPLSFVSVTEKHFNVGVKCFHSDLLSPFKAPRSPQKRAQKVSLKWVAIRQFAQWSSSVLDTSFKHS